MTSDSPSGHSSCHFVVAEAISKPEVPTDVVRV
jgi:hypothetical protein